VWAIVPRGRAWSSRPFLGGLSRLPPESSVDLHQRHRRRSSAICRHGALFQRPKHLEKIMKVAVGLSVLAVASLVGCASMPGNAPKEPEEHAAHHPAGVASGAPAPAQYDRQMKMMQEMHQKMAAAKTPEERAALMADHMKTMREGMAMMGQMHGGTMGGGPGPMSADPEPMKRRMDMMEMMMQMMMDRDGAKLSATK